MKNLSRRRLIGEKHGDRLTLSLRPSKRAKSHYGRRGKKAASQIAASGRDGLQLLRCVDNEASESDGSAADSDSSSDVDLTQGFIVSDNEHVSDGVEQDGADSSSGAWSGDASPRLLLRRRKKRRLLPPGEQMNQCIVDDTSEDSSGQQSQSSPSNSHSGSPLRAEGGIPSRFSSANSSSHSESATDSENNGKRRASQEPYMPLEQECSAAGSENESEKESSALLSEVRRAHDAHNATQLLDEGEDVDAIIPASNPQLQTESARRHSTVAGDQSEARVRRLEQRYKILGDEDRELEWMVACQDVPRSLLRGPIAIMAESSFTREQLVRGRHLYKGLPVFPRNNADLGYIYRLVYAARQASSHLTCGSFCQLRSTYGQLSRFVVSIKMAKLEGLHEPGAVFSAISTDVSETFLQFFRLHASVGTLAQKAIHMGIIVDQAAIFMKAAGKTVEAAKLEECRSVIRSVCLSARCETKRQHTLRSYEARLLDGGVLSGEEMKCIRKGAMESLHGMVQCLQTVEREDGEQAVFQYLKQNATFVGKYCIELTVALVMMGGGQRPQAYCSLLVPSEADMKGHWKNGTTIRVLIDREKTVRKSPYVGFPVSLAKPLQTYVSYVRPIIVSKNSGIRTSRFLLLHTRTGLPINTSSVRSTFRKYVTRQDQKFARVTPMIIRSSYATDVLDRFRKKLIGNGKTEEEFLGDLARTMNTSTEMLRLTYLALKDSDYDRAVRYLTDDLDAKD